MRKYYDIPDERLVCMINWENGYGTLKQAKKYFNNDNVREISLKEFNELGEEYSK